MSRPSSSLGRLGNRSALASRFLALGDRVAAVDLDRGGLAALQAETPERSSPFLRVSATRREAGMRARSARTPRPDRRPRQQRRHVGGPRATTLHETPVVDFDRVMATNIRGPFLLCRLVLPAMIECGKGVIVNIASVAGIAAFPGRSAYSASKGALIQLTRSIAVDYARHGVRAVALCPGMIATPFTQWRLDDPKLRAEVVARIPQGEVGSIAQVVAAVTFLASDEASYFNGASLPMDGGYLAL